MTDFTRRTSLDRDLQPVAIISVDPATRTATAVTRTRNSVHVNCAYATGDTITIPAVGEQWYVERFDMEWRLYGRIPFNDATLNIEPEEGQVSIGSASGPLELNGTEIRSNGKVFRLNGVYYRDDGETLQRSVDKIVWEPISGIGGGGDDYLAVTGIIQLIGNALAGIPVTAEIADYLAKLNEEESSTLTALAAWASGLGDELGGVWDVFCDSPFFAALRQIGEGDSPLDQVVSGFQTFINDLWTSLFCGFTGDLTPQAALTGVQGLAGFFADNPFIQGLASLLGENAVGNLLLDAVGGATEFLQQIVDALFCDFTGDLTPENILTSIAEVLQPLIDNPFIQGLATLADTLGTGVGNLFQDAIAGATGLVDSLFRALFCDFEGDLTPQDIISHIGDLLQPLIDNPFIQGLATLAETLGTGVGNLAADAISGATGLIDGIFRAVFCDFEGDLTPQDIISHIGDVFSPLINNPFIQGLATLADTLGTGVGNLASDAISGATGLIDGIFRAIFCDFTGDLTPQDIISHIGDVFDPLINNPFIQGLATLADTLGTGVGNLAADAISGATGLIDGIFRAVFCDFEGDLTPQDIIGHIGDVFDPLINNPFIQGLATLAETLGTEVGNLASDAISGATGLVQAIFGAIFCDFSGTFTPQTMLTKLVGVLTSITTNPFVAGLISFAEGLGHTVGGGIEKAFAGANELLEAIFNIFFCSNDGVPTPQVLVDSIGGVMDFIRTNPLIVGLVDFIEEIGTTSTGFLQKALEGAFTFFNQIVNTIFCNLPGSPTPTQIMASLSAIIGSVTANPYVGMLRALADHLGDTSTNLIQQTLAGVTGLFDWVIDLLNTFFPLLDWDALKTLDFPDLMTGLIGDLNPLAFLTEGKLNLNWLPQIGVSLITDLSTHLQTNVIGPIISAITGGLTASLTGLTTFFGGFGSTATTLVGRIISEITGLVTGGVVSLQKFSENLQAFFGANVNLLSGNFNPATAVQSFITTVLSPTGLLATLTGGKLDGAWLPEIAITAITGTASYLQTNVIGPIVSGVTGGLTATLTGLNTFFGGLGGSASTLIGRVVEHFAGLILGNSTASLSTFFTNLRALFTGVNFFPSGAFSIAASASAIITNLLNQATGVSLLDTLIPNLDIGKITNLVQYLTGDVAGNVQTFFTNLRSFFNGGLTTGGINFLSGSFNPVTALNTFLTTVLSQATSFLPVARIPTLDVSKIDNLVKALTGQTITGTLSDELTTVRDFFDGLGGGGGLVSQLVSRITGTGTTLTQLQSFFSGFSGTGGLLSQVVGAMTGTSFASGPLKTLSDLFAGVNTSNSLVNQVTASLGSIASSLDIASMVSSITGVNVVELTNSYTLTFAGSPTGGTFTLSYGGSTTAPITYSTTAATTAANIQAALVALTPVGASNASVVAVGAGKFTASISNTTGTLTLGTSSLTGGTSPTLTVVQKFRGPLTALASFFTGFDVFAGTNTLVTQVLNLAGSSIGALVSTITGMTESAITAAGGAITVLDNFFDGFDVFGGLTTSGNTLVNQIVRRILGGDGSLKSLTDLGAFFTQLRTLFGFGGTSGALNFAPAAAASALVGQINSQGTKFLATAINDLGVNQISSLVKFVTGSDTNTAATLQTFFAGLGSSNGGTATATSLASLFSRAITGKTSGVGTLAEIASFLGIGSGNLLAFDGTNSLIGQIVAKVTGDSAFKTLDNLGTFFTNIRDFFGTTINFKTGFAAADAINKFITDVLNTATTGRISQAVLGIIDIGKINNLVSTLTGKVDGVAADLGTFFTNLRGMFGGTASLIPAGAFNPVTVANTFITNVLSSASNTLTSLIPAHALTAIPISQVENLISFITGGVGSAVGDIQTFFTNLRTFLGFNPLGDFTNMTTAVNQFFTALNTVNPGTKLNPDNLLGNLGIDKITNLVSTLTGGTSTTELGNFFTNLRTMLNVGTGGGQINLMVTQTAQTLREALFGVITGVNTTANALITQTGLSTWLGAASFAELGNFFTNLTQFFKIADFKLAPATFTTNIGATASKFINDVLNQATGTLLSPLKVLGVGNTGTLSTDLNARPLLTGLTTWLTEVGTTNDIQKFFSNLRSTFGLSGINLLPTTFDATALSAARSALFGVITGVNDGINTLITQTGLSTWLGAASLTEISNFFTNLRKFLNVGTIGTDVVNFLVAPGSFSVATAVDGFIKNILNSASAGLIQPAKILGALGGATTLATDLTARPLLSSLRTWLTASDNAATEDIQRFFTNLRAVTGLGATTLTGSILSGTPLTTAQNALFGVITGRNDALNTLITQTGLRGWLGAADLTEIGHFFTNLTKFFKIADFKLDPTTGFNIGTVAGKFIKDVLNVATVGTAGALIDPTKVFGVGNISTLSNDLGLRPLTTNLTTWLTTTGTTTDIQKFFSNIRSTLGLSAIDFLPVSAFDPAAAKLALHNVVLGINSGLDATLKWATQSGLNGKAAIDAIVQAITSATGAVNLSAITTLFGGVAGLSGSTLAEKWIGQITGLVTGGVTTLTDFFAGLGSGTATVNSLVHRVVSSITGITGTAQSLSSLGTFFGSFTSSASTLVGKVVDHLTGLIASGLSGMTLTNFFSGFNGTGTPATNSIAHKISQAVGGSTVTTLASLENFFTNLRSFLGIGTSGISLADFVGAPATFATNLTGIINSFITNVLQRSGLTARLVTLASGLNTLTTDVIPSLGFDKIPAVITALTGAGTSSTDVANFFTNLRTFLGGSGFLVAPSSFSIATVAETFISTVLRNAGVVTKLVSLNAQNVIDAISIPDLGIDKITNLIGYITGTSSDPLDIQRFFTNVRSLFGGTNFLVTPGSFNLVTAANQFIVNVLSKATQAGIGPARIAADVLADFSLEKVTNLAKALTGQTVAGASGDLLAVQRFFTGFSGFDPLTGANNLVNQITKAVFGTSGTLTQLQSFFSGFTGFDPVTGVNTLVNQITKAVTGNAAGALADISRFLGIGASNGGLLDFSGANTDTLINQIVKRVTGTGTTLAHLANLFTNIRIALGLSDTDLHTGVSTPEALRTLVFSVIRDLNVGLNTFISQDKLKEWLGGTATLTQIGNFFANLKTFFGGIGGAGFDLLSGAFSLPTAINSFITGILNQGTAGLFNVNLLPQLDITKISNLVGFITGKTTGFNATDLDTFFGNLRKMVKHGTGAGEINLNAVQTVDALQTTLFNVITGINTTIGTGLTGLVTNSGLTTWLGGTTTAQIKIFFDNLKTLFGGINLLPGGAFDAATEINKLFTVLNSATSTLNPLRILGLDVGSTNLVADLTARLKSNDLLTWITSSGTTNDIQRFFSNLKSVLGLGSIGLTGSLLTGTPLKDAQAALHGIIRTINADPLITAANKLATQAVVDGKATITTLVEAITGSTGELSAINSFFSGFSGLSGTTLLNKITTAITGGTDLVSFFTNLRSFFTSTGINLASFSAATAVPTFLKSLLNGSGLIPSLNSYRIAITGTPTGGNYRLTYGGQGTVAIGYDATAATVQAELVALTTIGPGNATVTGSLGEGFTVTINNLTGVLNSALIALTGGTTPTVTVSRQIAPGIIPKLGVDWLPDIEDWVRRVVVEPMVGILFTGSGLNLSSLGIDITQLSSLNNALGAMGVWANKLLTQSSKIPVANLLGVIPSALLGVIPVANIAQTSPNLLTQGAFGASTTITNSDGWTWDDTPANNYSGTGGSAKLTVSTVKMRELFSQQAVPVTAGNQLTLSAWIKTSGLTVTQANPISISLIPFNGGQRVTVSGVPVTVGAAEAGINTAWTKITGTYTVPEGVTSVIVRLAVSSGASAGSVWFDDVSLTKTGLLRQGLVDRLVDGWNNLWDGLLGNPIGTTVGRTVDSLFQAANSLWQSGRNTALSLSSLLTGLISNAGTFIGNIGGVLMDGVKNVGQFLTGLWNGLTGNTGTAATVDQVAAATNTLQITANNAGLNVILAQNAADGAVTAAGTAQTSADDAQKQSIVNASQLAKLLASQTATGAGANNIDNFDYINVTGLSSAKWATYSAIASGAGYYATNGTKAYWVDQGGAANTWLGRFLSPTNTSFQNISVVLDTPVTESPLLGGAEAYLYVVGRADTTMANYVYARIGRSTLSVWKKVSGYNPIQIGATTTHTVKVGDTINFLCGTGTAAEKQRQFKIVVNGVTRVDVTDGTFYGGVLSAMSTLATTAVPNPAQTNNFGGFGGQASARLGGGQSTPGALAIISVADNPVTDTLGSGIRVYRSNATITASVSNGDNIFPLGWFGSVDTITPDLRYESQTGKVTVSMEGWYYVNIQQYGDSGVGVLDGGRIAPLIWKGTGAGARTQAMSGTPSNWNSSTGWRGFGGSLLIYLKAGDYIEPGYSSTDASGVQMTADTAGVRTWFSVALMNRSYA